MSTYDPKSGQITIGGRDVILRGVTSVRYEESTDRTRRRGYDGRTSGRVSETITLEGPAAREAMDSLANTVPGLAIVDYSTSVGSDGRRIENVSAQLFSSTGPSAPRPFSRSALVPLDPAMVDRMFLRALRAALYSDCAVRTEFRTPWRDAFLVTISRASGRPFRNRELDAARDALAAMGDVGIPVVVRDAASLAAKRDRALAPLLDPPPRLTREVLRARFDRLFAAPKLPLP